jgi:hypothetical protein
MATTGPVRGHNWRILVDDAGIFAATDCEVSLSVSSIPLAHKDQNPGSTGVTSEIKIADIISATGSGTAYVYAEGSNHKAIIDKMLAGSVVALEGTTGVTGDYKLSFNAIISGANLSGSEGDIAEISFDFESTGDITSALET